MRSKAFIFTILLSALSLAAQETPSLNLDGLKIPVELTKTIKAEKVSPGDPVRLRMAEAILVGRGLVIPTSAQLYGHVFAAVAAENGNRSQLSILVDRAEWKDHVIPLHAFIAAFGVRRPSPQAATAECTSASRTPVFSDRQSSPDKGMMFASVGSLGAVLSECETPDTDEYATAQQAQMQMLSNVMLYRSKANDYSVLMSNKNIHLPGGIIVMLENHDR